jgi:hypothetical protein
VIDVALDRGAQVFWHDAGHRDLHLALGDVSERMADLGVNDLGIAERGKNALDPFLHAARRLADGAKARASPA